jgi:hypothetical protein
VSKSATPNVDRRKRNHHQPAWIDVHLIWTAQAVDNSRVADYCDCCGDDDRHGVGSFSNIPASFSPSYSGLQYAYSAANHASWHGSQIPFSPSNISSIGNEALHDKQVNVTSLMAFVFRGVGVYIPDKRQIHFCEMSIRAFEPLSYMR